MSDERTVRGELNLDRSSGDFHYAEDYAYNAGVGLNADVVRYISKVKDEDPWLLDFRLKEIDVKTAGRIKRKTILTFDFKNQQFPRITARSGDPVPDTKIEGLS